MAHPLVRYMVVVSTIMLSLVACGDEDISENAARLRIKLTDSASPVVKELNFDIKAIEVYATDTVTNEGEWVPLAFEGGKYNLLALRNGKTVDLVDQYFPAGKRIEQVKLIPGINSYFVPVGANNIPLNIPPEIAEGIVIDNVNLLLSSHIISSIVIDVNVTHSVRESNGNYFLYPVARAFAETFGGKLRGYVAPVEVISFVAIVQETDTLITLPEADGMFMFTGLNPGPWEVYLLTSPEAGYRDTLFTETIEDGKLKEILPKPITLLPK